MPNPINPKPTGEPGWTWRRLAVYPVIAYGCHELQLLINAPDTRVNEAIAEGWLWLIAVLVLGYTGFATIQDVAAIWRTGTGLPYKHTSAPIDGEVPPGGARQ